MEIAILSASLLVAGTLTVFTISFFDSKIATSIKMPV